MVDIILQQIGWPVFTDCLVRRFFVVPILFLW